MADDQNMLDGLSTMLGGPVDKLQGKDMPFPGGAKGKPLAQKALDDGFVEQIMREVVTGKGAKAKVKHVAAGFRLSELGYRYVAEAQSPKRALEAVLPVLESIDHKLDPEALERRYDQHAKEAADRCLIRFEQGFAALQKTIADAIGTLKADLEADKPEGGQDPYIRPVIEFVQRIGANINLAPAPILPPPIIPASAGPVEKTEPRPKPAPAPKTQAGGSSHFTSEGVHGGPGIIIHAGETIVANKDVIVKSVVDEETLRKAIRDAYEELCLYVEFQDRLVAIPQLYLELQKFMPGVELQEFHEELEDMRKAEMLHLHVLNEVREARNPGVGDHHRRPADLFRDHAVKDRLTRVRVADCYYEVRPCSSTGPSRPELLRARVLADLKVRMARHGNDTPFRHRVATDSADGIVDVPEIHSRTRDAILRSIGSVRETGRSGVILIAGAAGSGKTHLLKQLQSRGVP